MSLFQDALNTCQAEKLDRYASNQLVIYRVCEGLSTLTAGFALVIGYKLRDCSLHGGSKNWVGVVERSAMPTLLSYSFQLTASFVASLTACSPSLLHKLVL
ncbi:MAG: hypothetical protein J6N81_07520 [Treponema sp.]|nr:hypothetical protein [Treponema sp.]MBO6219405.1 hypothetical protein [Treponema sp.]